MTELTPKQAAFVREYLKDHNATKAAIAAGYAVSTADSAGSRLLKHVRIKQEIAKVTVKTTDKQDLSVEKVVQEWTRIAFLDPGEFFKPDGDLKPIHEMSEDARRAIASLQIDQNISGTGIVKKLRTVSKIQGLEQLARHLGMFPKEAPIVNLGMGLVVNIHLDEVK